MPNPIRAETIIGNFTHVENWREVGTAGEPVFESGWTNYSSTTPSVRFYKDPFGVVHLSGVGASASSSAIFFLPEGYRPDAQLNLPAVGNSGVTAYIDIQANGQVYGGSSDTTFFSLDGATFRV